MDYNKFDTDMFENDYIIAQLESFEIDLKRGVQSSHAIDKCACILTAFMVGQITQAKNNNQETEKLEDIKKEIKHWRMLYHSWEKTGTHEIVLGAFLDKLEKIIL